MKPPIRASRLIGGHPTFVPCCRYLLALPASYSIREGSSKPTSSGLGQLFPYNLISRENRSVMANRFVLDLSLVKTPIAFHGSYGDHAGTAGTHGARHAVLQGHPMGDSPLMGEKRDGLEHRRWTTGEQDISRHALEFPLRELHSRSLETVASVLGCERHILRSKIDSLEKQILLAPRSIDKTIFTVCSLCALRSCGFLLCARVVERSEPDASCNGEDSFPRKRWKATSQRTQKIQRISDGEFPEDPGPGSLLDDEQGKRPSITIEDTERSAKKKPMWSRYPEMKKTPRRGLGEIFGPRYHHQEISMTQLYVLDDSGQEAAGDGGIVASPFHVTPLPPQENAWRMLPAGNRENVR